MTAGIASGHPLTSQVGADVLASGGTAVDAVIAGALMSMVVEPVLAGLLGGGVLMVAGLNHQPRVLDGFVQTPKTKIGDPEVKTIEVDFGTLTQAFHIGPGTIAAPSLVPMLFDAHARLGRIPMPELAAPAVDVARHGHPLSGFQAHVFRLVSAILKATDGSRGQFCADDEVLREGADYRNPDFADVLDVMAREGARFVTHGEIAQALLALDGHHLTSVDLKGQAIWRTPLMVTRNAHDIHLNPPPSLGGVLCALALECLPHQAGPTALADVQDLINRLRQDIRLDDSPTEAANALTHLPDLKKAMQHREASRGTTHISAIDAKGLGAALTLTNGEGCGHVLPGTGIMPNNMLGEEDLLPGGPVSWQPDTRLATMMCPTAITTRERQLVMLGSGGSNRIRSAVTCVTSLLCDADIPLEAAVLAPRLHVEDGSLSFEDTSGEAHRVAILKHWPEATAWPAPDMFFGGVHAVARDPKGNIQAFGDPRRAGDGRVI